MKSTKTIRLLSLLLGSIFSIFLLSINAFAQTTKVSGRVIIDRTASPASGATITVKNKNRSTAADAAGKFAIDASPGDVLEITMIGYLKTEVVVGKTNTIEVKLVETVVLLDDVVVIGYGHTKRKDVTGSISSVTGEELRKTQPTTFDQALQGKVAGLVIQQVSGQPGGGVSVQIRGLSSLGSNPPLYVIDGVIIGGSGALGSGSNPLAAINPSEIESIDVLKDASATAIYGSQATNGVVVITTKRGKAGPPRVTYDFYTGYQQIPKILPTMNLREFATFINERNNALGWGFDDRPGFVNPKYLGEGTNWQKELFGTAPVSNHTLTLSGGDNRTQYLFSGSYFQQKGIAEGSDFRRVSVRLNLDNKPTSWLKVGTSLQLAHIKEKVGTSSASVISTALSQTPDIPVQNPDGSWGGGVDPNGWVNASRMANPFALALIIKDNVKRSQVFGNAYAEITFRDFSLRNEVSGSFATGTQDRFTPTYTMGLHENKLNSSSYSYGQDYYTTLRNFLTYNRLFSNKYNVNAMIGHEAQLSTSESVSASRVNFPSNNVQAINAGDVTSATNSGSKGHGAQESYFGRVNFGWNDKYLFTGNVRSDGSSNFAAGNRWVTTYSGAFAWKINNEKIIKDVKAINELKLRAGYGLTNNQNVGAYAYTSVLNTVANGLTGIAQVTANLSNPEVEWEKTKYANVGLDGAFFKWRLSFSVDFYDRKTDGLLLSLPLPFYSGTSPSGVYSPGAMSAPYVNIGSVSNKGFDFRISSTNISNKKGFTWKTDLTVSHNINKILKLNSGGASLPGYFGGNIVALSVVGRSIGEFYGYQLDGIFATAEDLQTHARPINPTTGVQVPIGASSGSIWFGDFMFKDLNGDGVIDQNDQTFLGSPIPKFQIGFNNTFAYKNFDMNIFFSSNVGNKVLNGLRTQGEYPATSFGYLRSLFDYARLELIDPNGSATDINNVHVTNPNTKIPGLRNDNTNGNTRMSDKFIEDGSFIRCKNISLGYTISEKLMSKVRLHSLRLYINVTNAFIITKYKGMDPEIGSWNPLSAGMDGGFYPQPRVFTFGANLALTK